MSKQVITFAGAPKRAPISPGIRAGDFIFTAGQVGFEDAETGAPLEGIEAQTRQCLENVKKVLAAGGATLDDVVRVGVFLVDTKYFAKMNEVYQKYFTEDWPARTTVVAGFMIPSMLIEIECVAYSPAK